MAKLGREARKVRGRAPKEKAVAGLATVLGDCSQGFYLCNNKGLTVAQVTTLRANLRAKGVAVKVVKNSLLRIALKNAGVDTAPLEGLLTHETVVFSGKDPVVPAKSIVDYAKDNPKLEIKGGYFEGKVLNAAGVDAISKLPGKPELIARLMGSMKAPSQNLVYALNQAVSKVVFAVDAHRRKLEAA